MDQMLTHGIDADIDSCFASSKCLRANAGVDYCFVSGFKHNARLWVHGICQQGQGAEVGRVELVNILDFASSRSKTIVQTLQFNSKN